MAKKRARTTKAKIKAKGVRVGGATIDEIEIDLAVTSDDRKLSLQDLKNLLPFQACKIFIGHGRSRAWKELKDLLADRLHLEYDEFNRTSAAGRSNKERLEEMLDAAHFAFLVMTAEDEHADGTRHARENVIHEAGLFQGRLGFERAIILLEDGCSAFSNVDGVGQIRFPAAGLLAKSEEIREVLEREKIIL
jgi:predicted nucleotide-binding protein